jgi:hypothetical protein
MKSRIDVVEQYCMDRIQSDNVQIALQVRFGTRKHKFELACRFEDAHCLAQARDDGTSEISCLVNLVHVDLQLLLCEFIKERGHWVMD